MSGDYRQKVNEALVKLFDLVHSHKFSHLILSSDEDFPLVRCWFRGKTIEINYALVIEMEDASFLTCVLEAIRQIEKINAG